MKKRTKKLIKKLIVAASILLLLLVVALTEIYVSNNVLQNSEVTVSFQNLPESASGLRIAVVSDLHGKEFGRGNKRLIENVKNQEPDIIAVTGDIVDDTAELDVLKPFFEGLAEIAPVYYVFGNHEWAIKSINEIKAQIEGIENVRLLQNEYELFEIGDDRICILGIEDLNGPADMHDIRYYVDEINSLYGEDTFIVALCHRNDRIGEFARNDVDVVLSGHGHGGLIRLPFLGGLIGTDGSFLPQYTSGANKQMNTVMVVSRGLGNSSRTIRVFNRPEVVTVILEHTI